MQGELRTSQESMQILKKNNQEETQKLQHQLRITRELEES